MGCKPSQLIIIVLDRHDNNLLTRSAEYPHPSPPVPPEPSRLDASVSHPSPPNFASYPSFKTTLTTSTTVMQSEILHTQF